MIVKARSCSLAFVLLDDFNKVPHIITLQTFQREVYYSTTVYTCKYSVKTKKFPSSAGESPCIPLVLVACFLKDRKKVKIADFIIFGPLGSAIKRKWQ
jgi:hypothetical protein